MRKHSGWMRAPQKAGGRGHGHWAGQFPNAPQSASARKKGSGDITVQIHVPSTLARHRIARFRSLAEGFRQIAGAYGASTVCSVHLFS
jgi:hypothetical protein